MSPAMSASSTVASARWQTVREDCSESCVTRCIAFACTHVDIPSLRAFRMITRIGRFDAR
jgi:hypothetical protein